MPGAAPHRGQATGWPAPGPLPGDGAAMERTQYPLACTGQLSLEAVAGRCGLHPELVRRFVALGLVEARRDAAGRLCFEPGAPAVLARIQRLHAGLDLNYASIGLVLDLLDRISELEAALRRG